MAVAKCNKKTEENQGEHHQFNAAGVPFIKTGDPSEEISRQIVDPEFEIGRLGSRTSSAALFIEGRTAPRLGLGWG